MALDIMSWLFGSSPQMQQTNRFTPQQQQYQNQLVEGLQRPSSEALNYIMQILSSDPELMAQFEEPYKMQFEQETLPGIAERFAGMGTGGALGSSAFQQTLGRAGKELSTQLAALRGGLKQNALQGLQGFQSPAFAQQRENLYQPGTLGLLPGLAQGAGQGAGRAAANYFLSPTGSNTLGGF